MDILIFALIAIIVAAIVIYILRLLPVPSPFDVIATAIILLIVLIVIVQRAGYL
jgi:hypothetical protein